MSGVKGDIIGYSWVASDNATYEQIKNNLLFIAPTFEHFDDVFMWYARSYTPVSDAANLWSDMADIHLGLAEGTAEHMIVSAKVGTSGIKLLSSYKLIQGLGVASSAVGYMSTATSLYYDWHAYNENSISGYRFAWRTGGNAASIVVGAYVGSASGPLGAIAGGAVGGGFWAAEQAYDGLKWYGTELSKGAVNFQNNGAWFFRR